MRYVPFIYLLASPDTLILSNLNRTVTTSLFHLSAIVTELNANPATYGLTSNLGLVTLPAIPAGKKGVYYGAVPAASLIQYPGESNYLIDAQRSEGFDLPNSKYDALLTDTVLGAILSLQKIKAVYLSATVPNRTVAAVTGTTFTVTAGGAAVITYQWQVSTDGGLTWTDLASAGNYSGTATATLTLAATIAPASPGTQNGWKFRCRVANDFSALISNTGTLTVT